MTKALSLRKHASNNVIALSMTVSEGRKMKGQ